MEYTSFRKVLKALKSPSGGLQIVDRTVFFEFFDINSIDGDSKFFVLMSKLSAFNMLELLLYFEKNCEVTLFKRLKMVSENTSKIMSMESPITRNSRLKN